MRRLLFLALLVGCAAPNTPLPIDPRSADSGKLSAKVTVDKAPDGTFSIRITPQWTPSAFRTQAFDDGLIDHYELAIHAYGFGTFTQDGEAFGGTHNFTGIPPFNNLVAFVKGHSVTHTVDPSAVIAGVVSAGDQGGSVTLDRNSTPTAQVLYALMNGNHPRLAARLNVANLTAFMGTLPAGRFPLFVQPDGIAGAISALNTDPTAAAIQLPADGATNAGYVSSPSGITGSVTFNDLFDTDALATAFSTGPTLRANDPSSAAGVVNLATGTYALSNVVPGGPWKISLDVASLANQADYLYTATAPAVQTVSPTGGANSTVNFSFNLGWPTPTLTSMGGVSTGAIAKGSPKVITVTGTNFHPSVSKVQLNQTFGGATVTSEIPCTFVSNTQCTFSTPVDILGGTNSTAIRLKDASGHDIGAAGAPSLPAAVAIGDSYAVAGAGGYPTLVAGSNLALFHYDKDGNVMKNSGWGDIDGAAPSLIAATVAGVQDMAYEPEFDRLYLAKDTGLYTISGASGTPGGISLVANLGGNVGGLCLAGASSGAGTKGVAYVTIPSSHQVKIIDLDTANVTTFAGNVAASINTALLNLPNDVVYKVIGIAPHLFVAQGNETVLDINISASSASVIAGSSGLSGSADGIGTAARFSLPYGLTGDPYGNLYLAEAGNRELRKITPTAAGWVVTTLYAWAPGEVPSSILYSQPNLGAAPATGNQGALVVGTSVGTQLRLD